jgi:hypothetical protein
LGEKRTKALLQDVDSGKLEAFRQSCTIANTPILECVATQDITATLTVREDGIAFKIKGQPIAH